MIPLEQGTPGATVMRPCRGTDKTIEICKHHCRAWLHYPGTDLRLLTVIYAHLQHRTLCEP